MSDKTFDGSIKELVECEIFEYLELEDIPEEQKAEMMENIIISLRSRIMLRIADVLEEKNDASFENFKKLLGDEKVTESDVQQFLDSQQINLDAITAEETLLLKAELMGLRSKANKGGIDGVSGK